MTENKQVRLAERPTGMVGPETFTIGFDPIPTPGEGEIVVRTTHVSLDPAMRGWLNDVRSYIPPVGIGEVMRSASAGFVEASNHPDYAKGDAVTGSWGVQYYATVKPDEYLAKCDLARAPMPVHLGGLGITGLTAYFGLIDVGLPKAGETVLVSGAAGAVGTLVGQIAKILGCRAVGIAGGPEKCARMVEEFGFDACIDYKSGALSPQLREACPDGVDVFFDNVGGETLDTVLRRTNRGARIVICGAISQYNSAAPKGPANYMYLLVNRARMEGFVVFDYAARYDEAREQLLQWHEQGKLKFSNHIIESDLEGFHEILNMLFRGENFGKLMIELPS